MYTTWQFHDQRVLLLLHSSLSEEAMAEVLGLQIARDVWLALEAAYSHDSVERMHTLKDSLRALTKGNSTVAEFGRKFKAICDQLAAIGRPVDEDDKTHWFLCGLGASFENFSTAIMATSYLLCGPSLRALLAQAESHEIFLKSIHGTSSSVPPAAFVAQSAPLSYQRSSGRNSSQQRGGSNGNRGGRGRGRRPPHCQLCRTDGHYADKCPDIERIISQRSKSFSNTANLAQAFQANCNLDSTKTPPPSDWYVDSGASAHMTPSTSNLDSFVPYSGSESVQIGNGLALLDVLVVPHLAKNLLSISKLTSDYPVDVYFSNPMFAIQNRRTREILAQGKLEHGLYVLNQGQQAFVATLQLKNSVASHERWQPCFN
ncbi:retrovirus-related pol polyprotein from transposon RE1 [Tanacetum coccineum]